GSVTPGINSLTIKQAAGSDVTLLVENTRLDVFGDASNAGTLAVNFSGKINIRGDVDNRGKLEVGVGSEMQIGGSLTNYGQLFSTLGGAHFYVAGATKNLGGTITVDFPGSSFDFGGYVMNAGHITVGGGLVSHSGIDQLGGTM